MDEPVRRGIATLLACLVTSAVVLGVDAGDEPVRDVRVPGSGVTVRLWPKAYAIDLDGRGFSAPRATDYRLRLRHGSFDPLEAVPPVEAALAAGPDTNLYIVQFVTQPLEAYRAAVRRAGGTVHAYLARHAHVVRMDAPTRDRVAAMRIVRWVGPFHPAYRVEEDVRAGAVDPGRVAATRRYNVMVFEAEAKGMIARRIARDRGVVDRAHAGKFLLEATLTWPQVLAVARWDEVAFVDAWSPLEVDMDLAREIGGANVLEALSARYTGHGVRGEVIDAGFNLAHVDFQSRPLILHTPVGSDSHGASTSGIIFGDGTGDARGRGMLPDAQGIVASIDAMTDQARYDLTSELLEEPFRAVFQSSSIGSARTTFYTTISADIDAMLFDFDVAHCQSQSNAGSRASRPQAWAKNIISGGGVRHRDTLDRADDHWGQGASIGPATDGRIKPDLTHFYDDIFTTTTGSPTAYRTDFGGTSGATPIICGHVGLLFEMWADGAFGNAVDPAGDVFDNRCHMATAKALLINTAHQYDWTAGGPNEDLDRFKQGWGMPDLAKLYAQRFKTLIVDEGDLLENLQTNTYDVVVAPGEPALKATLVYTDPPGVPFSSEHRINDLTLRVSSPSGIEYWGNHGLLDGLFSVPGGAPNAIDTVENVFVENPEAGTWTVEVIAFELIEDGHAETPGIIDADYALVVSGLEEDLPPLFVRRLDEVPELVDAGVPVEVRFELLGGAESIVPDTERLHYRFDEGGAFVETALEPLGDGVFRATVPPASCADTPAFFVSVEGDGGTVMTSPPEAPDASYAYVVGVIETTYVESFEEENGWTVENVELQDGAWERAIPSGPGFRGDPTRDFDGSGSCYVTQDGDGDQDVDGGPTRLISPRLDATVPLDPVIGYARWFTNDDRDADRLDVELSADDGVTWTLLESVAHTPTGWVERSFRIADFVTPTSLVRLRFSASDNPNDSITEAGVDAVSISSLVCDDDRIPGDVDDDGLVDFNDLLRVLDAWGVCERCPEDLNDDGVVDLDDLLVVLSNWSP